MKACRYQYILENIKPPEECFSLAALIGKHRDDYPLMYTSTLINNCELLLQEPRP